MRRFHSVLPEEHKAGSIAITGTHSDYNLKRNTEEASNVRKNKQEQQMPRTHLQQKAFPLP